MNKVKEILDLIEVTTDNHDSFLFELRAAIEAGDKSRITYWTGILAKYVGELTFEVMADISYELVD